MQGCNSNWSNDRLRLSINDNSLTPLFASSSRILPVLPQNVSLHLPAPFFVDWKGKYFFTAGSKR